MEIKEHFLNIFESEIFVKEIIKDKNSKGPTLLFLHEGLGSVPMFRDFPEKLCETTGLNAFLYDRTGYGRSEASFEKREKEYLHKEAFRWLPEIIKKSGLKDIILIGHSDGGTIALLYASKYRVRGLVTLAAHVFVEDITIEGIKEAVKIYETTGLKKKLEKYHGDKTENVFRDWSDTWLSDSFSNWNIEEYLPGIKSPLLVLQGEDDEYATIQQVESITKYSSGKTSSCIIPNAKHVPHLQSEKTLDVILDFIAEIS